MQCSHFLSIYLSIYPSVRPPIHPSIHPSIYLSIYLWLYSPCGPWPLFHFLNPLTVGRTSWTGDQSAARPKPTRRTTQTQNKCKQTIMPWVEFEPTIPVFERAKTIHALGRAATLIDFSVSKLGENICVKISIKWNELISLLREEFFHLRILNVHKKLWDILL
jgi:hypothetical protein